MINWFPKAITPLQLENTALQKNQNTKYLFKNFERIYNVS
jgi:hypothetical protein